MLTKAEAVRGMVNSGFIRDGQMVEVTYRGRKGEGYSAGISRGRFGMYTDPLEVMGFRSYPIGQISIRRLG